MNTSKTRHGAALVLLLGLGLAAGSALAARVEDAAKDAVYDCPVPAPEAIVARATELGAAYWDRNQLACAADLWFAIAGANRDDPMPTVQALLATTAYIDHVNTLWSYDLYSIRQGEWTARVEHAASQGRALEAALAALPVEDANLLAVRALYRLTWPQKFADTKTQLAESRAAMGLLARAVEIDPGALEGNALWILGRLYYDVPEFIGGDPLKGLKLLEQAYRATPKNASLLRYSAYVYAEERQPDQARGRLRALLALPPDESNLQLFVDELKGARDLAVRLPDPTLAAAIDARRAKLLAAHPQLLNRLATAANLHGGVDPITGKDY